MPRPSTFMKPICLRCLGLFPCPQKRKPSGPYPFLLGFEKCTARDDEILFGWRDLRHYIRNYVIVALLRSSFRHFLEQTQCIYYICHYAIEFIIRSIERECCYYICNCALADNAYYTRRTSFSISLFIR